MIAKREKNKIGIWLAVLGLLAAVLPLLYVIPGMKSNWDIGFHISRFNAFCGELAKGNWYPIYYGDSYYGQGYMLGAFYGALPFYPFALLVLMGVSNYTAFSAMLVFYGILMTWTVFWVCFKISEKQGDTKPINIAIITALLTTADPYRYRNLFYRGAVGESISAIFIPLAFYGAFCILKEPRKWMILALAVAGACYTHSLTVILTLMGITVYFVYHLKDFWKSRRVWSDIFKAAGLCIILVAPYAYHFFKVIRAEDMRLLHGSYGAEIDGFYLGFPANPVFEIVLGMIATTAFLFCVIRYRSKSARAMQAAISFLLATTCLFPWKLIAATPLAIIQFSWRFLVWMPIAYFYMARYIASNQLKIMSAKGIAVKGVLILSMVIYTMLMPTVSIGYQWPDTALITKENFMGIEDIGLGEYLPAELAENEVNYARAHNDHLQASSDLWRRVPLDELNDATKIIVREAEKNVFEYEILDKKVDTIVINRVYYHGLSIQLNGHNTGYSNTKGWITILVNDGELKGTIEFGS